MRTVQSSDGLTIVVGENANENDKICANARQNDLWFHLDGKPSPHVLLSVPELKGKTKAQFQNNININNIEFSQSIHEACQLLKHFSSDKNASQSTVNMVQAKFVSRTSPNTAGRVTLKKSPQNLSVVTDQSMIDDLLQNITRA